MKYGIMHSGTKQEVISEILNLLELGPKWSTISGPITPEAAEEANKQYRSWANTWILPDLKKALGRSPEVIK